MSELPVLYIRCTYASGKSSRPQQASFARNATNKNCIFLRPRFKFTKRTRIPVFTVKIMHAHTVYYSSSKGLGTRNAITRVLVGKISGKFPQVQAKTWEWSGLGIGPKAKG